MFISFHRPIIAPMSMAWMAHPVSFRIVSFWARAVAGAEVIRCQCSAALHVGARPRSSTYPLVARHGVVHDARVRPSESLPACSAVTWFRCCGRCCLPGCVAMRLTGPSRPCAPSTAYSAVLDRTSLLTFIGFSSAVAPVRPLFRTADNPGSARARAALSRSIRSLGSRLAARFASFGAIAAFRSAAGTRVSPGSPQLAISCLDSLPGRFVLRCVSALSEGVEFPVQRDADSLRLHVPGFIIVRPFLNGIKCIRTVSSGNVDGYENGFGSPRTTRELVAACAAHERGLRG